MMFLVHHLYAGHSENSMVQVVAVRHVHSDQEVLIGHSKGTWTSFIAAVCECRDSLSSTETAFTFQSHSDELERVGLFAS